MNATGTGVKMGNVREARFRGACQVWYESCEKRAPRIRRDPGRSGKAVSDFAGRLLQQRHHARLHQTVYLQRVEVRTTGYTRASLVATIPL